MTDNRVWNKLETAILMGGIRATSYNTAYTLRATPLPFGTLLPLVATSYMLGTLYEMFGRITLIVTYKYNKLNRLKKEIKNGYN